jgi:hypothetical protein
MCKKCSDPYWQNCKDEVAWWKVPRCEDQPDTPTYLCEECYEAMIRDREMAIQEERITLRHSNPYLWKRLREGEDEMTPVDQNDYKKRYENLCREIKERSKLLKQTFNEDVIIDRAIVTTTEFYDRIVDES